MKRRDYQIKSNNDISMTRKDCRKTGSLFLCRKIHDMGALSVWTRFSGRNSWNKGFHGVI